MNCRHCHSSLQHIFLDLGFAPPSNAFLSEDKLKTPELYFPLKLYVCDICWLVQTEDYASTEELFTKNYAYFSSISTSWLEHARKYSESIMQSLNLDAKSFVVEIASNDGYLLKRFVENGIPCLGVEPTDCTAKAAESLGIPVVREFFSKAFAEKRFKTRKADLIIANNVFGHVPDVNDFTVGLKTALKPDGTITLEFPHLLNLIQFNQFDTVYHEHYSYLSLYSVKRIFERAGLRVFDVEELSTHGGSLRVYGCHNECNRKTTSNVTTILNAEKSGGLLDLETYLKFQTKAEKVKDDLLIFLIEQKRKGGKVAAYGAAAKGNTLLNYAGVKPDLLPFVYDAAPSKQGMYLPGSHIPILSPELIREYKPSFLLILPWNIANEVMEQNEFIRGWNGHFVTSVPVLQVS